MAPKYLFNLVKFIADDLRLGRQKMIKELKSLKGYKSNQNHILAKYGLFQLHIHSLVLY